MQVYNLNIHDCFYRLVKFPDIGYFIERCTVYGFTHTKLLDPLTLKLEKDEIIYNIIQTPYTDRIDGRGIDNSPIKTRYGGGFFGIYNPAERDDALTLDDALKALKEARETK